MSDQNLPPEMQCAPALSCSTMMAEALNAYHQLTMDGGVQEVSSLDESTKWHKTDLPALKNHIATLHATCPSQTSAAILGIGARRSARGLCFGNSARCNTGRC